MFEIFRHHNAEGGPSTEERVPTHDELLMRNNIQRGLMDHFAKAHGHEPDDPNAELDYAEWIQKNADAFARAYEDIEKNDPEILDNWPDHASLVYEEISKRMGGEPERHKIAA